MLDYYQRKFRYVLVDEYQDTNHLQYLLTSLLAGGYKNLCVVGDDDQSIYRFRGANIENILNFEEQYPTARTIRLEQNYQMCIRDRACSPSACSPPGSLPGTGRPGWRWYGRTAVSYTHLDVYKRQHQMGREFNARRPFLQRRPQHGRALDDADAVRQH